MLRYPLLVPSHGGAHAAAEVIPAGLPVSYPGENALRQMSRTQYDYVRHWPTSEDFRRQCDQHQVVDAAHRGFLADAHDGIMGHIAWHSGFHAAAVFDRMAAGLRERERARAREEAAAAAGRRKMWRSSMKMMTD